MAFVFAGSCRLWSPSGRSSSCSQSKGANSARICGQAWQSTARRRRNAGDVSFWFYDSRARVGQSPEPVGQWCFGRYRRRCGAWARCKWQRTTTHAEQQASEKGSAASKTKRAVEYFVQAVKRTHTHYMEDMYKNGSPSKVTCFIFLEYAEFSVALIRQTVWPNGKGSYRKSKRPGV